MNLYLTPLGARTLRTTQYELRTNLVSNMQAQWEATGYLFEQYNQDTGDGQRNHPFAGWSALVLLAIAEIY